MTDPTDADDRIRELVEQARLRREKNREVRAQFAAARTAGLRRRHAAKLARNQEPTMNLDNHHTRLFTELRALPSIDERAFRRIGSQCAPQHLPALLWAAHCTNHLPARVLAAVIAPVWFHSSEPEQRLGHHVWRRLFDHAGYTRDGRSATRPDHDLELWRGAPPDRANGWSWTSHRGYAQLFAQGPGPGQQWPTPGRLWRITTPRGRLLAHLDTYLGTHAGGGQADEYIVDTRGLTITEAEPPPNA